MDSERDEEIENLTTAETDLILQHFISFDICGKPLVSKLFICHDYVLPLVVQYSWVPNIFDGWPG